MPKDTFQAEATSNSEKIKPVALTVIKLCWSEGIRQLVSQSVSRKFCQIKNLKFHDKLLKAFQVDLKACLGLVLPNQYYPSSSGKIEAGYVFG